MNNTHFSIFVFFVTFVVKKEIRRLGDATHAQQISAIINHSSYPIIN